MCAHLIGFSADGTAGPRGPRYRRLVASEKRHLASCGVCFPYLSRMRGQPGRVLISQPQGSEQMGSVVRSVLPRGLCAHSKLLTVSPPYPPERRPRQVPAPGKASGLDTRLSPHSARGPDTSHMMCPTRLTPVLPFHLQ